jgi:hypothetical protein
MEKRKKIIFMTGLHNKPQDCGASVASAAGPFTKKKYEATNLTLRRKQIKHLTEISIPNNKCNSNNNKKSRKLNKIFSYTPVT